MIKSQAVNLPPWKIVSLFARVIDLLERVQSNLEAVRAGGNPSVHLLPTLSEYWAELSSLENDEDDDEDGDDNVIVGSFHDVPVLHGWLMVGEKVEHGAGGKKQVMLQLKACHF